MIDTIDFSGMYPLFLGYGCMLLALLFWFVWPKAKAERYGKKISWPRYILHYFHPLAWILFSLASFTASRQPILAGLLIFVGAIAYFVFIMVAVKA